MLYLEVPAEVCGVDIGASRYQWGCCLLPATYGPIVPGQRIVSMTSVNSAPINGVHHWVPEIGTRGTIEFRPSGSGAVIAAPYRFDGLQGLGSYQFAVITVLKR